MRLENFCEIEPKVQYIPEYDPKPSTAWYGIKALWYEGAAYQGKKTKVFAYIGYPEMKEGQKVPAVVLVHGGGGHAFAEWIKKWNQRGFAAIAMDTTGYFPNEKWRGLVGTEEAPEEPKYTHDLYGELEEEGYRTGPDKEVSEKECEKPLGDQWLYHGVVDIILAHNILRSDSHIMLEQIGIAGISWGAVITSLAIGYDLRYAFAIPVYGSAYLDYLPAPQLPQIFREPLVKKAWSAAERLGNVNFPVLWQCWCYDTCFSIGANSLSYQATKKSDSFLCMLPDFGHGHLSAWNAPEGYRFASSIINGKLPLIKPVTEPEDFGNISFEIAIPEDFTDIAAEIYYLTEPAEYDKNNRMTKEWKGAKAEITNSCVSGTVPEEAYCYFVELKGFAKGECYISDTALVEHVR
ncbi:MAG: hypothetical protein J6C37_05370 [Roseburia sp.]|nr:hypothetical protein [Roseburia sp.]